MKYAVEGAGKGGCIKRGCAGGVVIVGVAHEVVFRRGHGVECGNHFNGLGDHTNGEVSRCVGRV